MLRLGGREVAIGPVYRIPIGSGGVSGGHRVHMVSWGWQGGCGRVSPRCWEGPGTEAVANGYAPVLSAVGCAVYHKRLARPGEGAREDRCSCRGDSEAGRRGRDRETESTHLRPHLQGCENAGSAAACVRAWAFCVTDCALGAAFLPELTPPLYGSGFFRRGCLQLSSPICLAAGGSGDDTVAACGLFHWHTPIRWAVSVHECWLGGICSLSGSGLFKEQELQTTAVKCTSTTWRLRTVSGEDGTPSLRYSRETVITLSRIMVAVVSLALGEPPDSMGFAVSTEAGVGSSVSWSSRLPLPKKWATAETCLHSWILGQSGQSHDSLLSSTT